MNEAWLEELAQDIAYAIEVAWFKHCSKWAAGDWEVWEILRRAG